MLRQEFSCVVFLSKINNSLKDRKKIHNHTLLICFVPVYFFIQFFNAWKHFTFLLTCQTNGEKLKFSFRLLTALPSGFHAYLISSQNNLLSSKKEVFVCAGTSTDSIFEWCRTALIKDDFSSESFTIFMQLHILTCFMFCSPVIVLSCIMVETMTHEGTMALTSLWLFVFYLCHFWFWGKL